MGHSRVSDLFFSAQIFLYQLWQLISYKPYELGAQKCRASARRRRLDDVICWNSIDMPPYSPLCKYDIIHKTESTEHIAMPPEKD